MREVASGLLLFVQLALALVAVWQVLGLMPVLSWFGAAGVTTGMWLGAGIKVAIFAVSMLLWWLVGRLRARVRGSPRPA